MKKIGLFLLVVFALHSSPAWAQKVEIVPFYGTGFAIGCGAPGGCYTGVSGFATTLQGNVNGGLIIAF